MGFEAKKDMPIWAEQEKVFNVNYISKNEIWLNYLINETLAECVKEINKQKLTLVDYGCGEAFLTMELCALNKPESARAKSIQIIGYEPNENLIKQTINRAWETFEKNIERTKKRGGFKNEEAIEHSRNNFQNYLDKIQYTSEQPEKESDIVLLHFSLHHMKGDIEKILREEIDQKMKPEYLIIGEFDYKGNNVSVEQFEKFFSSTEAGKKELAEYQTKDSDEEGLEKCYEEHVKIGLQDCLDVLEKIGYEVEDVAMGNMENPTQAMKFLIKAKRAEQN